MATPPNKLLQGTWFIDRVNIFFRIRRYLRWVAERWFILAACLAISVGVAIYKATHTPNIYLAFSKVSIAPKIQVPGATQSQFMEALANYYDSQLEFMQSEAVLGKVYEATRDHRPVDPNLELIPRASKGPNSFSLEVESTDLKYATEFAKAWAREFLAFKEEMKRSALSKEAGNTTDAIAKYEKDLEKVRAELYAFQREHNISTEKETADINQRLLETYEAEYLKAKSLRERLEKRKAEDIATSGEIHQLQPAGERATAREARAGDSDSDPLARFDTSAYSEMKVRILSLEAEKAEQEKRLKPAHPHYIKLTDELARLQQQMVFLLRLVEEKRLAQIESLKQTEEAFVPQIEATRQKLFASKGIHNQADKLRAEEQTLKEALDNLRRREQSLDTTAVDETRFNILEPGVGNPNPVRPDRRKMVLAGVIFGLGAGLGLIYLLGRLDDRAELAEEVEKALEFPILGQIPLVNLKDIKQERVLITTLDKHNMFAEALRGVRSAVLLGMPEIAKKQVLIVSSAAPGDGKTTITTNFAMTLAIAGHKVLLVDADLRRGNVHSYFGGSRDIGFSDVLMGELHWTDVARETPIANMQIITSGKLPANPGELLINPITKQFLEEVRGEYDFIVFDCPPLTAIDDTFSLVGLADGLLFVVMSGQTSMRFAKNALLAVQQRGATILGVILNGIKPNNPYHYYQQYYYTYYSANANEADVTQGRLATKMAPPKKARKFHDTVGQG